MSTWVVEDLAGRNPDHAQGLDLADELIKGGLIFGVELLPRLERGRRVRFDLFGGGVLSSIWSTEPTQLFVHWASPSDSTDATISG